MWGDKLVYGSRLGGGADSFSVRLSGSPNLCIGRVEVFHRGKWGTVCDDEWDALDAAVVCRELDCGEALSAPHGAWFGEGSGPIWLNEVRCKGTEQHLHGCRHKGFRRHVCTHEEDASAICSGQHFSPFTASSPPPTVRDDKLEAVMPARPATSVPSEGTPLALRLVGGRSRCSGRVEVLHQGQWGTVCDDMWGLPDVTVICRELGCGEALAAPGGAIFGEGNKVIWLDDVQCQGGESKLTECLASPWGTHNCRHNEAAGAVCSDEMPLTMVEEHLATLVNTLAPQRPQPIPHRRSPRPTQPTSDQVEYVAHEASRHVGKSSTEGHLKATLVGQWQVKLVGGSGSCAGRVEVLHKDTWGTVCDDGWDVLDATVVCRELGCGSPLLSPGNALYGPGTGPIWLDDVNCTGKESTLQHCQSQPWGQHNCNHNEDASVICTGMWKPLSFTEPAIMDSNTAELIPHTQAPSSSDKSGLYNILDTAEAPTQGVPPAWEMLFPSPQHPDELFLPPTDGMELEDENEEPTSLWNVQQTTSDEEIPQDVHHTELTSPPKARSSTHRSGLELTDSSVTAQSLSALWDLESEREAEPSRPPRTVMLEQGLKDAVDTEPSIQWDNMSREPPVTKQAELSSSSPKIHPGSAIWVAESEREIEPTSFSGIEFHPVTQDLNSATETVTQVHWNDIPGVPVTQEPAKPSTETPPASTMGVWESEREMELAIHGGMESFSYSENLKATSEMETPTATQNAQHMNNRENISLEAPDSSNSKADADPEQKESMDKDPHTVRSIDTISTTGQTKAPGTSEPSADLVTLTAQLNETPPGCPVRQELRKEVRDCCCSPDSMENMAHAMDGLRGDLGSLSTAIRQQGSQLEAVAQSLAHLATSVHQLIAVLPALMKPAPTPPSPAPCMQDKGEIQNQLPLK
uniref:Uncharacterized protein n=1 Tax=Sphaerodactylus townsendi TaxID=933632 RepID=A0ACB8EUX4_9SAUR